MYCMKCMYCIKHMYCIKCMYCINELMKKTPSLVLLTCSTCSCDICHRHLVIGCIRWLSSWSAFLFFLIFRIQFPPCIGPCFVKPGLILPQCNDFIS